jgi:hypothetical protein
MFVLLSAALVFGADNPWAKVKELKTGTEIRVYKTGSRQPLTAKFSDASDENLIVIIKNEQTAIPKDEIDRIDYRPPAKDSRVTRETKTVNTNETQPVGPRANPGASVPGTSSSSSITMGGKPDFETLYRRSGAAK